MSDVCSKTDTGFLMFWCPGCQEHHGPAVEPHPSRPGGPVWSWNGSFDKPTISPSILVRGTVPLSDEQVDAIMAGVKIEPVPTVCHSFVKDGQIQFLNDCTHSLSGKTVSLEPF